MSENNMSNSSKTNWELIDSLTDDTIDTSDIPPLSESFFARATLRRLRPPIMVILPIDPDVLAWFKAQGKEYEERINAALRIYVEAHKAYHS